MHPVARTSFKAWTWPQCDPTISLIAMEGQPGPFLHPSAQLPSLISNRVSAPFIVDSTRRRLKLHKVVRMLIQESHVDVTTSVNGQNGSMSTFAVIPLLNTTIPQGLELTTTTGIFLFHPTVPGYPQASVISLSLYLHKSYNKTGLNVLQQIPWRLPLQ